MSGQSRKLAEIKRLVSRVLRILKKRNAAVEIYFVGDREMNAMHGKTTNVLAYPEPEGIPHPETKKKFLGEIYLNPGYIVKEGGDMRYLAVHGLLHLLGYDHKIKRDGVKMEKVERKIMQKIN